MYLINVLANIIKNKIKYANIPKYYYKILPLMKLLKFYSELLNFQEFNFGVDVFGA